MPDVCVLSSQNLDREAWLGHCHKGYLELDREQPFFDALGDFRTHIAKCEEHVTTALSEVRILSLETGKYIIYMAESFLSPSMRSMRIMRLHGAQ